jgi:antitoxin HicB
MRDAVGLALNSKECIAHINKIVYSGMSDKTRVQSLELPPSIAAKVVLMNEMVRQRVRPAELARRLNTNPRAVNRLVNLKCSLKIDGIDEALKALGKTLEVRAV